MLSMINRDHFSLSMWSQFESEIVDSVLSFELAGILHSANTEGMLPINVSFHLQKSPHAWFAKSFEWFTSWSEIRGYKVADGRLNTVNRGIKIIVFRLIGRRVCRNISIEISVADLSDVDTRMTFRADHRACESNGKGKYDASTCINLAHNYTNDFHHWNNWFSAAVREREWIFLLTM